jgi:hypothetical protein
MRNYKSDISFVCPACNEPVTASMEVPEPDWTADRASDMVGEEDTEVECPECDMQFPAFVLNRGGDCMITLHDHPETKIEASMGYWDGPDEEEPWADYSVPTNPYAIYLDSYHETGDLLAEHGGEGMRLINRMIFSQQISALEAFLGDTLINRALDDNDAIQRLLATDVELAKLKFSLAEVMADRELVKTAVKKYLKSIIYHNLPKVRAVYKIVFEFDLFAMMSDEDKEAIIKAIEYRHDCVHRNGRDKDGNILNVFTKEYVQTTADVIKTFVMNAQKNSMPPGLDGHTPF